MHICKVKNYQELSRKAANLIAAQVILKPDSVLGLATGSSPVGTYNHLVEMYENGDLDGGAIPCGEVVGRIKDVLTVKEVIDEIVVNSEKILRDLIK